MTKTKLIEIPVRPGNDIGELLQMLVNYHNEGKYNYFLEIYGQKFYSKDINYDEAFTSLVGCTPEEHKQLLLEEERKRKERLEKDKEDAIKNLGNRIEKGKKQIRHEKHEMWIEFVKKHSEAPYYTREIDSIIEYLTYLNTELDIEEIAAVFKEQYEGELGNWYTSTILTNIAKFHPRGIELFEYLREIHKKSGHEVADSTEYLNKLRNINVLLDMGETLNNAITLTNNKLATINISGMKHITLINENTNLMSKTSDYMLVGQYFDEQNHIIYVIDGTKVNSYLTVNGETAEIYIDGRLGDILPSQIDVKIENARIEDIAEEYDVAYAAYTKLDIETLLRVLKEIRELTLPSKEVTGEMILHDEMRRYKSQIIKLKKSTN